MLARAVSLLTLLVLSQTVGRGACLAESLRHAADRIGMLVGAAVDPDHFTEAAYTTTLVREFNLLEPEDAMKWGAIRPSRKRFDFAAADKVVAFAQAHQMKARGHTLVWWDANPEWLTRGDFTPAELSQMLHDHIDKVMQRYVGKVFAWDVVNEAFDDGKLIDSIWYNKPGIGLAGKGTAYIEQAFRWARAADPHALLFYNDWGIEGMNPKSDAVYAMVKDFKKRGVPIDGVGLQAHVFHLDTHDLWTMAANLKRFVALGVQVQVTEMDIGLPVDAGGAPTSTAYLHTQAQFYREVAKACVNQRGCTAFQTWGLSDKYTWITGWSHGKEGAPLMFDAGYQPKPAYQAVMDAFRIGRATGPR
jgi:endo-1,4-beta-xylanase